MIIVVRIIVAAAIALISFVLGLYQLNAMYASCTLFQNVGWLLFPISVAILAIAWRRIMASPKPPTILPRLATWEFVVIVAVPWLFAITFAGPTLLGAIDRGKQSRTVADLRSLARIVEMARDEEGNLPASDRLTELLLSKGGKRFTSDGWGEPYELHVADGHYYIISYGRCAVPDVTSPSDYGFGQTSAYAADIVVKDGELLQWPEGMQR